MTGLAVSGSTAYAGGAGAIRKIDLSTGAVSLLAGNGTVTCGTTDGSSGATTTFTQVLDVAYDATNVWSISTPCFSSGNPTQIRKTDRSTGATTTLASTLVNVTALTIGTDNNLYVTTGSATTSLYSINKMSGAATLVVALGGTASALTADSSGLFVSVNGAIKTVSYGGSVSTVTSNAGPGWLESAGSYLYGSSGTAVWQYSKSTGAQTPVAGTGSAGFADGTSTDAWFNGISGIASDGSSLFVADSNNYRVRKIIAGSALPGAQGSEGGRTITVGPAKVSTVADIGATSGGSPVITGGYLYVAVPGAIKKVSLATGAVSVLTGSGTPSAANSCPDSTNPNLVQFPDTPDLSTDGYYLYSVSSCRPNPSLNTYGVRRTSLSTGATSLVGLIGTGANYTTSVAVGGDGFVYVSQQDVYRVDPVSGAWTTFASTPGWRPGPLTADGQALYMTEWSTSDNAIRIVKVTTPTAGDPGGTVTAVVTFPPTDVWKPFRIVSTGKYLYTVGNARPVPPACNCPTIYRFVKSSGSSSDIIAGGAVGGYQDGVGVGAYFAGISGFATDGAHLYATDTGNQKVRLLAPGQYPHDVVPNASKCNCQYRAVGQPVDVQSGNFYHSFADIGIPGRSGGIGVTRTYSASNANLDGPFGFGWSSPYSMRLQDGPYTTSTGPVKQVVQENSAVAQFTLSGMTWSSPPDQFATLVHNGDGTWTFTRRAREQFVFDATGALSKIVATNGFAGSPSPAVAAAYTTTVTSSAGLVSSVTDPAGRSLTFTYWPGTSHIQKVTDPTGRHVDYTYNAAGELTDSTDVAGGNWHFTYDPATHWLLTMRNPRGKTIATNIYDDAGRVSKQTDALGAETNFDYTSIANSVLVTEPPNNLAGANKTLYTYDSSANLASETHGYGSSVAATWNFTYNATTGTPATVTDPNGHVTSTTYDGAGNRTDETVDPTGLNLHTYWVFDALNGVVTVTDPKSVTTTNTYDGAGNMTSTSTPWVEQPGTNQATVYWHGDASHPGDVTTITDPTGQNSVMTYDSNTGDLLSVTSPTNDKTTYTYDTLGRRLTMVAPEGNKAGGTPSQYTTSYQPNAFGDPLTVTDPLGHITTYTYDEDRNVKTVKDAKTQITTNVYDDMDQLTSVQRADTPQTTLGTAYWPDGSTKSQTDGNGKVTNYTYDEQGRLAAMADPLSRTTSYGYDGVGNQTSVLNPSGQTTTIGYDHADRRTSMTYSDGVTPNVAIGYDNDGQRTSMIDGSGATAQAWVWDSLHRLTSQTDASNQTVSYGYDLAGRKTAITYATGKTVNIAPDNSGRTHTVTDWLTHQNTFDYDHNSNLTTATFANGVVGTITPDRADQTQEIKTVKSGATLADWVYTRDNNNLLSGVTSTGVGPTETYSHNPLNQLATQGSGTYSYDSADNLTKLADGTNQSFDAANQLCWTSPTTNTACGGSAPSDATTYGYDGNGNRATKLPPSGGQSGLAYDQGDRLKTASVPYESGNLGQFTPLAPFRVLDSRSGGTGTCYQPNNTGVSCISALAANTTRYFQVAGFSGSGVPASGVNAVSIAVTAWTPSAAGTANVFASDASTPSTQLLTFASGVTATNGFTAKLGADGRLAIRASVSTNVAVDVVGYYSTSSGTRGGTYIPVTPRQLATGTLNTSETTTIQVTGNANVPAVTAPGGVSAVVAQLNVTGTTAAGLAEVWETGLTRNTSARNLSFANADNQTTMVTSKLSSSGQMNLFAGTSGFTYTIRVLGYYTVTPVSGGALNVSQTPTRLLKTGTSPIGSCTPSCGTLAGGAQLSVQATGAAGIPGSGVKAVSVVVTAVSGSTGGNVKVGNTSGSPNPTVQVAATETSSNGAIVPVDADGKIVVLNNASGNRDVLIDVVGWQEQATNRWTYTYDGDGLRTKKTAPDGTVTTYLWDHSEGMPLLLGEKTNTSQTYWINGPEGLPVEEIQPNGTTVRYYQHDQIGSTRLITDGSGAIIGTATYDPYGKKTAGTGVTTPLGFTGQYTDSETGFQYLRARYYDPSTGQFLTRDPLDALTRLAYGYVAGSPLNGRDPSGLDWWDDAGDIAGEIVDDPIGSLEDGWNSMSTGEQIADVSLPVLAVAGLGCAIAEPCGIAGSTVIFGGGSAEEGALLGQSAEEAAATGCVEQQAIDYATRADKLDHLFAPKHGLDALVEEFGSREGAAEQVLSAIRGLTPSAGRFDVEVQISGQRVVVRGAVVNGVTKLGTMFTP